MQTTRKADPRFLQLGVLSMYAILAREIFHFARPHWVTLACVATAILLDLVIGRLYYKKVIPPISAAIIGLACSILIDSPHPLIYLLAVTLAIASKAFLTYRGKHFYNPGNFGAALVLVFLPNYAAGIQHLFVGYFVPSLLFVILGLFTVTYAKQLEVSLSWFAGFVIFALVRAQILGVHPLAPVASVLGPGFLLFTFHMISDPATTPRTRPFRLGFGIATAALDAVFRLGQVPNGQFYALIIMSSLIPWIREWERSSPVGRLNWQARVPHFAALMLIATVSLSMKELPGVRGVFPAAVDEPENVRPRSFSFVEAAREMGIDFTQADPLLDLNGNTRLLFLGTGAAVADFNGDGFMDILLVNSGKGTKNRLYLNRGGKRFVDASERWDIASTNETGASVSATVFDYDNDGRPDVYIARMGCSMLFRNTGLRFVNVSQESGLTDCRNSIAAIPLDYDRDGRLDLYVLRYWPALDYFKLSTPHVFHEGGGDARNGGENSLYRNLDGAHFQDRTQVDGGGDTHWSIDAQVGDFAGDGVQRLIISNDFGRNSLFTIRGGKLADETGASFPRERRYSMGVSLADLSSDGTAHVLMTDIHQKASFSRGNLLWDFGPGGVPVERAGMRGLDNCGWAWGAAFADFGLSGREDAYIANGMITGTGTGDYRFSASVTIALPSFLQSRKDFWAPIKDRSFYGRERDCVFENVNGTFERVTLQVGIAEREDTRAVALIDIENNGSMDVLTTTQNGSPHLLKNTVKPGDRWIGFRLEGTRSNRDGAGARVEVRQGSRKWYRWATAGHTGFLATSDPRLHFGIPDGGSVDVLVAWPSGIKQQLKALRTGKYHTIRESQAE